MYWNWNSINKKIEKNNVKTKKQKGSCASLYNSSLNMSDSQIYNYHVNCFFGLESNIIINNTLLDNSQLKDSLIAYDYGSFYCQDCSKTIINNSKFIRNSYALDGSAICIKNTEEIHLQKAEIIKNSFIENSALMRGTILVDSSCIQIRFNNFFGNTARTGGAIFIINELSNLISLNHLIIW